jgi:hypothetical protein
MNVDQLLAIVEDLSLLTTIEQLENRLSECRTAYVQLKGGASGKFEREKAVTVRAAIAKMQNKMTAIEFSERREAQRALEAASSTLHERFTATDAKSHW